MSVLLSGVIENGDLNCRSDLSVVQDLLWPCIFSCRKLQNDSQTHVNICIAWLICCSNSSDK